MEQLDGHGVVGDVVQAVVFGQARVAEKVGAGGVGQGALHKGGGVLADDVDGVAEVVVGDALDYLDSTVGVVAVDEEVGAEVEEFGAVAGDVGDADDTEAGEFGELEGDEAGCRRCYTISIPTVFMT